MDPRSPFDESRRLTLEQQLGNLLRQAQRFDGRPVSLTLQRGLRITLTFSFQHELILQLDRKDTFPSSTEWDTVLRKFPGGGQQLDEKIEGGQDRQTGRYWLRGRIQVTPPML